MLNRSTLKRINNRPNKARLLPPVAIGVGFMALAALLIMLTSSLLLALAALLAGAVGVLVVYRAERASRITTLNYDNLSDEVAVRFSAVREACEALSASDMIWRLGDGAERPPKAGDIALSAERTPVAVGLLETPGIRTNVPIWGIAAGDAKLFFFPEAVLIYRNERYEGVSYESVKVAFSFARFFEKEAVPEDAEIVEYRHYGSSPRIPVVLYGLLEIILPHRLEVLLQISELGAAARFAKTFGAEEAAKATAHEEHTRNSRAHDTPPGKERTKVTSAHKVLGVREDASMSEITAAYRKMVFTYHPDKVLNLPAEARELSEWRMKEINAAYTELKRHGSSSTDGRAG
jgi:hypothetical protein